MFRKKAKLVSSHQYNYIQSVKSAIKQYETFEYFKVHNPKIGKKVY